MFEQLNSVRQCLRVVHLIFPALLFVIGAFAPENKTPRTTTHSQIPLAFERNQGQSCARRSIYRTRSQGDFVP